MLHFRLLIAAALLQAIAVLSATAKDEDAEQHLVRTLTGHKGRVQSFAFSPDGHFALSAKNNILELWDLEAAKKTKTFEIATFKGHTHSVTSVAFSPDGRFALSSEDGSDRWDSENKDATVKLWDVATGKEIRTFAVHAEPAEEAVTLLDKDTGKVTTASFVRTEGVTVDAFSPDGQFALSHSCSRWETKAYSKLYIESGGRNGSVDAINCLEYSLKLWEVATGRELRRFTEHNKVTLVTLSPDGRLALSVSSGKTLKLWDVTTGKEIKTFTGHEDSVSSVAFSPDGRFALAGSKDETMKLWDVTTGQEIRTLYGHIRVSSVTFSPDGRYIMSGGCAEDDEWTTERCKNGSIDLWNASTGRKLWEFTALPGEVSVVKFSPDSRFALCNGRDGAIRLWDIWEWTRPQESKE
jgi:VCBS repeat-containing protein